MLQNEINYLNREIEHLKMRLENEYYKGYREGFIEGNNKGTELLREYLANEVTPIYIKKEL